MKNYDNNKESSYLKYWNLNNFNGLTISQKLPVGFKWVENQSQFSNDFIEKYYEDSDKEYFLEVDVQYPEKLHDLHHDLLLPDRIKIEKL